MQNKHPTTTTLTATVVALSTGLAVAVGCGVAAAATPSVIQLPGDKAYPESITSTSDGAIYVGSFANGGVLRVPPGGTQAETFIKPGANGSRSTLGVLADEASNTLWVCSNNLAAMGVQVPGDDSGSALKGFDLKTGAAKISVKLAGEHALCNDIAIGPDKAAYVTNSFAPQILRLKPGATEFEVWAEDAKFDPPQSGAGVDGLAFGSDGNLFVNTFTKGELFHVEVKNGKAGQITRLQTARPTVLTDGIRPIEDGRAFLMVEGNGKLDRVTIAGDKATVDTLKDGFDGPTGVTVVGKTAWVTECQLSTLLDPAKKAQGPKLPFKLTAVELSGD